MAVKRDLEPQAKELRANNETYENIAEKLQVNEKTIRRWAKGWGSVTLLPVVHKERTGPGWPAGWTISELEVLPGYQDGRREITLGLIRQAESQGNPLIGEFFRQSVELAREGLLPEREKNWAAAIAGLPSLGDWLGWPGPWQDLARFIKQYKPWESSRERSSYRKASQAVTETIRQGTTHRVAQLVVGPGETVASPAYQLLALNERIPMFDKTPRGSLYRKYTNLNGIILGILAVPKREEPWL